MYPLRISRPVWTKIFYKTHECSDLCNTEYEIVDDNNMRITCQTGCIFPEKVEPLIIHVSHHEEEKIQFINEEISLPKDIKILINYPIREPVKFDHSFKEEEYPITIKDILLIFDKYYKQIYEEEEKNLEKKEWDINKTCPDCKDEQFYSEENLQNNLNTDTDTYINTDTTCSICFEDLDKENSFKLVNCNHIFHKECILKWFNTPKTNNILEEIEIKKSNSCPVCRNPIILCKRCNSSRKIMEKFLGVVPPFDANDMENLQDRPETNGPYKIHTLYYEELFFKGILFNRKENTLSLLPFEDISTFQET